MENQSDEIKWLSEEIEKLSEEIKANPEDPKLYRLRGLHFYLSKEFKKAIEDFSKAIDLNPEKSEYYYYRGWAYTVLEQYKEAIDDYNKAIKHNSKEPEYYYYRGLTYGYLEQYEKAIKNFSEAIKLKPKESEYYDDRGVTYFKWGKYKVAKNDFKKAIDYYNRAIEDFSKAIELNPDNAEYYNHMGCAYGELGLIDNQTKAKELFTKAKDSFNKAIQLHEINKNSTPRVDIVRYYNNRGFISLLLKDYDAAINDYTEAIDIYPEDKISYVRYITYAYVQKGEKEEIIRNFIESQLGHIDLLENINILDDDDYLEEYEKTISYLVDYDVFFYNTCNEDIDIETKSIYKDIYIKILTILSMSRGKDITKEEKLFAHYTQRDTVVKLLIKDEKENNSRSPLRLYSVMKTNDPEEGKTIDRFFKLKDETSDESTKNDYQAFIGCFTYNYENLNQFRLYGKSQKEEATGISLVFNNNFFSEKINGSMLGLSYFKDNEEKIRTELGNEKNISPINTTDEKDNSTSEERDNEEKIKYPLFRCIYVDPKSGQVISLAHKKEYLFYREKASTTKEEIETEIEEYNGTINQNKDKISGLLDEIKILLINKKDLKYSVLYKLFLPLRYIIKHVAFEEEEECRIICIKNNEENEEYKENKIKFTDNYTYMYTNYREITNDCLEEIIFAPKAEECKVLKEAIKIEGKLTCKCRKSDLPFS